MYIHRVVTKGVPGLPDQDLTFWDEFRQEPLHSILITGPNGSGKTTLLKVIAGLWDSFSYWLRQIQGNFISHMSLESAQIAALGPRQVLVEAGTAAIEIRGLFSAPLWLWVAHEDVDHDWLLGSIIPPDYHIGESMRSISIEIGAAWDLMDQFNDLKVRQERLALGAAGREETIPNMVLLPTENRYIATVDTPNNNEIQSEPLYQWLVNYKAGTQWNTHIESMLRNLKVRDPVWFQDTLKQINTFLEASGKSIIDFDARLRLTVRIAKDGATHPLSALSSGEQQFVILIFMMNRWLMPGGVMLIDEPDLYMHISWQQSIVHELNRLVAEKHGQLIVTSHSPYAWNSFGTRSSFNLNPLVQAQANG